MRLRMVFPTVLLLVGILLLGVPAAADHRPVEVLEGNPSCADIGLVSIVKDDFPPADKTLEGVVFDYHDDGTVDVSQVGDFWELQAVIVKAGDSAFVYRGGPYVGLHADAVGDGFRDISHVEVCGVPKETTTTTFGKETTTSTTPETTTTVPSTTSSLPPTTTTSTSSPPTSTTTTTTTGPPSTTTPPTTTVPPPSTTSIPTTDTPSTTVPDRDDSSRRETLPYTGVDTPWLAAGALLLIVAGAGGLWVAARNG